MSQDIHENPKEFKKSKKLHMIAGKLSAYNEIQLQKSNESCYTRNKK